MLLNSIICNNSSDSSCGGGIYNWLGVLVIINSRIVNNSAKYGGGISNSDAGRMLIINSIISNNSASHSNSGFEALGGGGIYNDERSFCTIVGCSIENNKFIGTPPNTGWGGKAYGGGIHNCGFMTIDKSMIRHNSSEGIGASMGWNGIANGGGVYNAGGLIMTNCTVDSNKALGRGGSGSSSYGGESNGGGIYNQAYLVMINSILWGNTASANANGSFGGQARGGGVYNAGTLLQAHSLIGRNTVKADNGNPHPGSALGDNYYQKDSVSHFMLNAITMDRGARDPIRVTRAVNTFSQLTLTGPTKNCLSGINEWEIFGTFDLALKDNGGQILTIAIDSQSVARGAGVRAGTYSKDTIMANIGDSCKILKLAYYDGARWLKIETDQELPAGTAITGITKDQRGMVRSNPPGIGPNEYGGVSSVVHFGGVAGVRHTSIRCLGIHGNHCTVAFPVKGRYSLKLITIKGQLLEEKAVFTGAGLREITLPRVPAMGMYVIVVTGGNLKTVQKLIIH